MTDFHNLMSHLYQFVFSSWLLVGFTVFIILAFYYVLQAFPQIRQNRGKWESLRIVHASGWYVMMLLEIYYSGALTMFFSTEVINSFETMRQVIQAYPDWNLHVLSGSEAFVIYRAIDGDPDYMAFWERMKNLPDETVLKIDGGEPKETHQKIRNERAVLLVPEEGLLRWSMNTNPTDKEGLRLFDKGRNRFKNLVVTNNSPLGPILRYGAGLASEKGEHNKMKIT